LKSERQTTTVENMDVKTIINFSGTPT